MSEDHKGEVVTVYDEMGDAIHQAECDCGWQSHAYIEQSYAEDALEWHLGVEADPKEGS